MAAHRNDMAKGEMTKRTDLRHPYVSSPAFPSPWQQRSPFASPIHNYPLTSPPMAALSPISLATLPPLTPLSAQFAAHQFDKDKPSLQLSSPPNSKHSGSGKLYRSTSTKPLLQPTRPTSISSSSPSQNFSCERRKSFRISTGLNLTGRASTHFKFWTTISADPSRRTSYLEHQKQKARRKTWIAWALVLGFGILVAGLVLTLLILKTNNVI